MLSIAGYSDRYSLVPGETIKFYINSEHSEKYTAQIVRVIHGDTNPDGPGYKEQEINAPCNGVHDGRNQRIFGGSYVVVPQDPRLDVQSFTLQAFIFPTTPEKGRQGILTKWDERGRTGYGLFVDEAGLPRRPDRQPQRPGRQPVQRQAAAPQGLVSRRRELRRQVGPGPSLPGADGHGDERRPRDGRPASCGGDDVGGCR